MCLPQLCTPSRPVVRPSNGLSPAPFCGVEGGASTRRAGSANRGAMAESLINQVQAPGKRAALIADAEKVLEEEVADKSGLGGIAIKTAFKVIKGVSPGFIHDVIDHLLDDFLKQLDPVYQRAIGQGLSPGGLMVKESPAVASALLSITDSKAARANSDLVKKTYEKLRPTAQKNVEAAAPRLAKLLDKHAATG